MIAVDTNILVYAHREDSSFHASAKKALIALAQNPQAWAIPWPCVYEFLAIVTHPKIYRPATPVQDAILFLEPLWHCPNLAFIGESLESWEHCQRLLLKGKIQGGMMHDARIASICLEHRIKEFWSSDRDFSRFEGLKVKNPLL